MTKLWKKVSENFWKKKKYRKIFGRQNSRTKFAKEKTLEKSNSRAKFAKENFGIKWKGEECGRMSPGSH